MSFRTSVTFTNNNNACKDEYQLLSNPPSGDYSEEELSDVVHIQINDKIEGDLLLSDDDSDDNEVVDEQEYDLLLQSEDGSLASIFLQQSSSTFIL